jgi:ATP-dependent DNA helicase RecG
MNDHEGCLFTATVHRKIDKGSPKSSPKSSPKTEDRIIEILKHNRSTTTEEMGRTIGISKRAILKQINRLKQQGRLRHIGPAKGGHWEVMNE